MTKARITGVIGNTAVMTEWIDNPKDGEMMGMRMDLSAFNGWDETEIEYKDE